MKWRCALIGCGKIGSEFSDDPLAASFGVYTHAEAYSVCPETELIAVADADAARAERCARRWSVPAAYSDPLRLFAEQKPEIISICTPDATHFELVRAAILAESVRGILAEKPLALEVAQSEELVDLARRRGVILAVNYSRRHDPGHMAMHLALRRGAIGDIRLVRGLYAKGTLHNGTHWLDLLRFLVGEVKSVRATDRLKESGPDPTLDLHLECVNGATAELLACSASDFTIFEMDLLGTRSRIQITESGRKIEDFTVAEGIPAAGYRSLVPTHCTQNGLKDLLLYAVHDLVQCLRTGAAPRCTGVDGVRALQIAQAARSSAASGQTVHLSQA